MLYYEMLVFNGIQGWSLT